MHRKGGCYKQSRTAGRQNPRLRFSLNRELERNFGAMVTGASVKGNWVRLINMPIEGMLKSGFEGIDVVDRIRVQLISVDVKRGFID